ncbi:MotA/TolQ/ExbB proton channel family protein [Variovorax humicola]|uniref:Biopolymer transport protein ExbB n=1 Tax=Variovorax humicola TaxID=1769758 RepID=A0ABU8W866_9BURK
MTLLEQLMQGDGVSRGVTALLLAMSIGSWVVILWKTWFLRGGTRDLLRSVAAFWQAQALDEAVDHVKAFDRNTLVLPSVLALQGMTSTPAAKGSLGASGARDARLTRVLRVALHGTMRRVSAGQILLATVGATAPFVGLLGTVWGIYHALTRITQSGAFTIDKVAGPVGEALIMTAAGLAVAIPAVLAYNWFGRVIGRIEAELEGFAHDLLAVFGERPAAALPPAGAMLV